MDPSPPDEWAVEPLDADARQSIPRLSRPPTIKLLSSDGATAPTEGGVFSMSDGTEESLSVPSSREVHERVVRAQLWILEDIQQRNKSSVAPMRLPPFSDVPGASQDDHSLGISDIQSRCSVEEQTTRVKECVKRKAATGFFYPRIAALGDDICFTNCLHDADTPSSSSESYGTPTMISHHVAIPSNGTGTDQYHRLLSVNRHMDHDRRPDADSWLETKCFDLRLAPAAATDGEETIMEHLAKFGNKKFVVQGLEHTLEAIQAGNSRSIECIACGARLQLPADAKIMYCACCHNLSSV